MARLPNNYFGPKQRITMLKEEHPGVKSAVLTNATALVVGETLCILIKASIQVEGVTVAEGHAFTDTPEDDKAVEKAETIAIGRALVNFGYPEILDVVVEEEVETASKNTKETKSLGLGGLGKTTSKKQEGGNNAESNSEVSEEGGAGTKAKSSGLGRLGSRKAIQSGSSGSTSSQALRDGGAVVSTRPQDSTRSRVETPMVVHSDDESNESEETSAEETQENAAEEKTEKHEENKVVAQEAPKQKMTREELLAKYKKT